MSTFEKVSSIISGQLGIGAAAIKPASEVVNDLGADSIDVVQLLMAFENEFGVTVTEDAADELKTVEDIVELIDSNK